jgi:hypothetical protein
MALSCYAELGDGLVDVMPPFDEYYNLYCAFQLWTREGASPCVPTAVPNVVCTAINFDRMAHFHWRSPMKSDSLHHASMYSKKFSIYSLFLRWSSRYLPGACVRAFEIGLGFMLCSKQVASPPQVPEHEQQ